MQGSFTYAELDETSPYISILLLRFILILYGLQDSGKMFCLK
jgi:hypothetical protein